MTSTPPASPPEPSRMHTSANTGGRPFHRAHSPNETAVASTPPASPRNNLSFEVLMDTDSEGTAHRSTSRSTASSSSSSWGISAPPPAAPKPQPAQIPPAYLDDAPTSLHAIEQEDAASDAVFDDANTIKARRVVRRALRTSPRFDAYHIDRILGYGTNGAVVAGHVAASGYPVAVKIIYRDTERRDDDPLRRGRGRNGEVVLLRALARRELTHPNLLHALDAWQDKDNYYVATDVVGSDWLLLVVDPTKPPADEDSLNFVNPRRQGLVHRLRVSPGAGDVWAWAVARRHMAARHSSQRLAVPDPRHVRQIFAQVAAAVYHLHAVLHTAHGDIKEENVLVQAARAEELCTSPEHRGSPPHAHTVLTAVLCDYGHAVRGDDDSRPPRLTSYGTAQVTPPELRRRPRRAGQRLSADGFAADVFALGVLLYTMLHGPGHVPRALDPAAAVTGDDGLWQPAWIPERGPLPLDADEVGAWVPRECVEIVRGMTMVRPEERWGMERVIAHPWVARG